MSAASGLTTAIIAGILVAVFGGSKYQVSGPTGAMTVILIPVVHNFGIAAIPALGIEKGEGEKSFISASDKTIFNQCRDNWQYPM